MTTLHDRLVADIDHFCNNHKISKCKFGELFFNDRSFVYEMEKGRNIKLTTLDKLQKILKCKGAEQWECHLTSTKNSTQKNAPSTETAESNTMAKNSTVPESVSDTKF